MMIATMIGFFSALALLGAGYIFGAHRGRLIRENLTEQLRYSQNELSQSKINAERKIDRLIEQSGNALNTEKKIDALLQHSDDLSRVVKPLEDWGSQIDKLDGMVKVMQRSVGQNNNVAIELTNLKTSAEHRSNLTGLMDEIIDKANFETVLLSDDQGLPLSGNSQIKELDKLAALSAFALIFCDRFTRDGFVAPLSLMTHDEENREMLCRIFYVGNQRFVLTAISTGLMLTSNALDPALDKVTDILTASAE